jgi:hypothetical protein
MLQHLPPRFLEQDNTDLVAGVQGNGSIAIQTRTRPNDASAYQP